MKHSPVNPIDRLPLAPSTDWQPLKLEDHIKTDLQSESNPQNLVAIVLGCVSTH